MANSFAVQLADALEASWPAIARPNQLPPPGDWQVWLLLAGRGFGKTRTLAEWVCQQAGSGQAGRIALVAATAADARDVLVEGQSGILAVSPPWFRPVYEPSKRRLTWPNGAMATTFSAEEPERLRGPQHDAAVCDELGAWSRPEALDMLQFGLRLGRYPRCLVATTPRPTKLIRELLAREGREVTVTRGSTYENRVNLARLGRANLQGVRMKPILAIGCIGLQHDPDVVRGGKRIRDQPVDRPALNLIRRPNGLARALCARARARKSGEVALQRAP